MEQTKTKRVRRRSWSIVEYALFGLALLLSLMMTVSGARRLIRFFSHPDAHTPAPTVTVGGGSGSSQAQTDAADNDSDLHDESEQTDIPVTDTELTQYADDPGYGGQIYALLDTHPEAAYVLRNLELYPEELLDFVVRYPQAMPFAAAYPDYDRMGIQEEIDLSEQAQMETVPLLIQWDTRWGFEPYGDGMLGCTGCGPTCLSMVSIYLTGWHSNDPASVASFAQENGYYTKGYGTAWTLMSQACVNFGLNSKELNLDENKIIDSVEQGHPVICSMGPGAFTDNGHYIVIAGHDENGFTILDPNSPENSERLWQFEEFSDQIKNLWSFESI